MNSLAAITVWAGLAWLLAQPVAQAQPTRTIDWTEETRQALHFADRHALQELLEAERQAPGWNEDGMYFRRSLRSAAMISPVARFTSSSTAAHANWVQLTRQWTLQEPGSAFLHLVHLEALISQGFFYRGGDYASKVTEQGWEGFRKSLKQAVDHATAHKSVLESHPDGFVALLDLAVYTDVSNEDLMQLGRRGAALNPDDHGAYFTVLKGLTPRWGGNAALIDRWINEAVRNSKEKWGQALYATMYKRAAELEWEGSIFKESYADWKRMNQGFRDLTARYPSPANLNAWAYFACLASDRPTFLEVSDRINGKWLPEHWGDTGQATLEGCRAWSLQS
jgi:hypothetical protein